MNYEDRSPAKVKFYNSPPWRRLARSYAASKGWRCEVCDNKYLNYKKPIYRQLHCHHKIELTDENLSDPNISLNADNLILLCIHCHNKAHAGTAVLGEGLYFDENGMVKKNG